MSIINSLKTFSKKAFNVEPNGSNIDEVLDDMASKVTPGSCGGSGEGITVFKMTVDSDRMVKDETGQSVPYMEIDATFKDIIDATKTTQVYIIAKRERPSDGITDFYSLCLYDFYTMEPPNDTITRISLMSNSSTVFPTFYIANENEKPTTAVPESFDLITN